MPFRKPGATRERKPVKPTNGLRLQLRLNDHTELPAFGAMLAL